MDALTAYKNVLKELDKDGSPTFSIGSFNYFFNSAIEEYITNNYSEFDITAKTLTDLQKLYVVGATLTFTTLQADLPADIRFPTAIRIDQVLTAQAGPYASGETVTAPAKRERSNQRSLQNAFKTATLFYPRYTIASDKVILSVADSVSVSEGEMDYIKTPSTVYLGPEGSDYDQEANNTTIEFPEYVAMEIVKLCRRLFIENIESPRYQTQLAEQQQRRE